MPKKKSLKTAEKLIKKRAVRDGARTAQHARSIVRLVKHARLGARPFVQPSVPSGMIARPCATVTRPCVLCSYPHLSFFIFITPLGWYFDWNPAPYSCKSGSDTWKARNTAYKLNKNDKRTNLPFLLLRWNTIWRYEVVILGWKNSQNRGLSWVL